MRRAGGKSTHGLRPYINQFYFPDGTLFYNRLLNVHPVYAPPRLSIAGERGSSRELKADRISSCIFHGAAHVFIAEHAPGGPRNAAFPGNRQQLDAHGASAASC
ncbi:hypothetical protein EYF80_060896 [Liparis tanakae]|uniref:Uncharacterized protein n=1 Tax=Liparis tanakae TaxID=230148 RepID=A0A4Z2EJM6_9TELE|nr:hypothetical protein EYF80_060896 [Liparis tanakae]